MNPFQPTPLSQPQLFADLDPTQISSLRERMQVIHLHKGDCLIRQGDEADCLYYLLRGRLDVLRDGNPVAEITAGEVVGEIAFFADTRRTADVVASRDSQLLRLGREAFEQVSALQPGLVQTILRTFGRRLARATTTATEVAPRVPDTIGLCQAGSAPIPLSLVKDLVAALSDEDRPCRLLCGSHLPEGLSPDDPLSLSHWLGELEKSGELLLMLTGQGYPHWDRAALRHCDQLLLCGRLDEAAQARDTGVALGELEADMLPRFRPRHIGLILWRDSAADPIAHTARWLVNRPLHLHHHLVLGRRTDAGRVARLLTGKALGAVFGGGGALGAGHLGALRALFDAGLELDIVGGTSIGSSVAMACAAGEDPRDSMAAFNHFFLKRKAFGRYTPPVYGMLDQRHVDAVLLERYGDQRLEDLPLNCYVVAANLTTNDRLVLRKGPCWEAMRMSASIPVALPPWVNEDGEVLVDGGLMDNVPTSVMHGIKPGPNLVFMLSPGEEWRVTSRYDQLPSRIRQLWQMITRSGGHGDFPRIGQTVAKSMQIPSWRNLRSSQRETDLLLEPPTVPGMGLTAFKLGNAQEQAGYDYTCRWLEQFGGIDALLRWRRNGGRMV